MTGDRERGKGGDERAVVPLLEIQKKKIGLIKVAEGEVEFSLTELALVLGIPRKDLSRLFDQRRGLFILPGDTEGTTILRIDKAFPERNLWDEVLQTLYQGRSELGRAVDLYDTLFDFCKQLAETEEVSVQDLPITAATPPQVVKIIEFFRQGGGAAGLDYDLIDIQGMAAVTFAGLTRGRRNELDADGRSLRFILAQ